MSDVGVRASVAVVLWRSTVQRLEQGDWENEEREDVRARFYVSPPAASASHTVTTTDLSETQIVTSMMQYRIDLEQQAIHKSRKLTAC